MPKLGYLVPLRRVYVSHKFSVFSSHTGQCGSIVYGASGLSLITLLDLDAEILPKCLFGYITKCFLRHKLSCLILAKEQCLTCFSLLWF